MPLHYSHSAYVRMAQVSNVAACIILFLPCFPCQEREIYTFIQPAIAYEDGSDFMSGPLYEWRI